MVVVQGQSLVDGDRYDGKRAAVVTGEFNLDSGAVEMLYDGADLAAEETVSGKFAEKSNDGE